MVDQRAAWAAAFTAAQAQMPSVRKGRTADMGNYSYSYADLGDVLEAALPVLTANGLSLAQAPVSVDGKVGVETRIYHEAGHVEVFGPLFLSAGSTPQQTGSALTYARRYSACAALGIAADDDDDGRQVQPAPAEHTVDLGDLIRTKVGIFTEWTEDERRDVFKAHAAKVLDGRPSTISEVDRVVTSMSEQYYEEHPTDPDKAPF